MSNEAQINIYSFEITPVSQHALENLIYPFVVRVH